MSAGPGILNSGPSAVPPPTRRLRIPIARKRSMNGLLAGLNRWCPCLSGFRFEDSKLRPAKSCGIAEPGLSAICTVTGDCAEAHITAKPAQTAEKQISFGFTNTSETPVPLRGVNLSQMILLSDLQPQTIGLPWRSLQSKLSLRHERDEVCNSCIDLCDRCIDSDAI